MEKIFRIISANTVQSFSDIFKIALELITIAFIHLDITFFNMRPGRREIVVQLYNVVENFNFDLLKFYANYMLPYFLPFI